MYTSLQAGVELALSTATSKNLGLDDEVLRPLIRLLRYTNSGSTWRHSPKFFATLKASSGVFAAMLFGVGMPYWIDENQKTRIRSRGIFY